MIRLALAAVCIAATGCAAGHSGGVTEKNGHPDPVAVAARFGCSSVTTDTEPELFAAAAITCDYRGQPTSVLVFQSSSAFDKWQAAAKSIGGGDGTTVVGDRFAVEASDADAAAAIAAKVDGTTF